ncbi:hypothetical protein K2173_012052 [Erythroxylum novogranatense]|uniref:Pentatricopeptide repeat-containing protein n=1 Tax=Erythroxylum novogranatense TaxID=1862640 RepID=A0AAV8TEW0_9ROSI|nr:hypothetical protein K2173_012052 [Erythroxylum novogranatense]
MTLFIMASSKVRKILHGIHSHDPLTLFTRNLIVLPPDKADIASDLVTIFTRQPFCLNNPDLKNIAPFLDTKVVETALNGFKSWRLAHMFFVWTSNQDGYKHNIYTYNAMASILSRAQQIALLRSLYLEVLSSHCPMSPGTLGFLIRCLGSAGLVDEANKLFDQVKMTGLCVPNEYTYNCLLEAISKSNSIELIENTLKEMTDNGWSSDKYTLTPVLQAYCNMGKFDRALEAFNEMYQRGWLDAYVFSILVLSLTKWHEVDKAFELIDKMEDLGVQLNEKTFCSLIHGLVKECRVDKALEMFEKMKKSGFAPDIALYDVLIGGLCRNKELKKALHLYSEMKQLHIQPDVGIIFKLASSFSEAQELVQFIGEVHEQVDSETLVLLQNLVFESLTRSGSVKKAHYLLCAVMGGSCEDDADIGGLFKVKKMIPPNDATFSVVIDGLLKAGDLNAALKLFQDMAQNGYKRDILLFNNMIDALCNSDRLSESCELLREMESSGFKPTHFTFNCIYGCLCRKTDVLGALDMVRKMHSLGHQPWIKHSTTLVKELCKYGKAIDACDFLIEMVEVGFPPHVVPYSACLDGLIKIQEVDRALKLFQGVCVHGRHPDLVAYNILIKGLSKAGRIAEAESLLNEMITKGLVPSVVTYNLLIDGYCKLGRVNEAMLYRSKMLERGIKPNVITFSTLVDGLCNADRPDDATLLWNEMEGNGCTPNAVTFMAFVHGLCKCSKPEAALVYLNEMEDRELKPDSYVYVAIIDAFLADSNHIMALEILERMVLKGYFQELHSKDLVTVNDAIKKLLEDDRTSSRVQNLISS